MKSKPKKKIYLVFLYPRLLTSISKEVEVKERSPEKVKMPKGAYCFYYYDEPGTGENNFSKTYYPGGEIVARSALIKKFPKTSKIHDIVRYLRDVNVDKVIITRLGTIVYYDPGDSVILPKKMK